MKVFGLDLGPNGWALAVVFLGALLSFPFLRQNSLDVARQENSSDPASQNFSVSAQRIPGSRILKDEPTFSVDSNSDSRSLPEWARKTSPLDSLIQQSGRSEVDSQVSLPDKKPTPQRVWTLQPPESSKPSIDSSHSRQDFADHQKSGGIRSTPFSEIPDSGSSNPQSSIAKLVWPDVAIDEQLAEAKSKRSILPASRKSQNGSVVKQSKLNSSHDELPPARSVKKTSDERPAERARPFGAQLKRELKPDDARFIYQPGRT